MKRRSSLFILLMAFPVMLMAQSIFDQTVRTLQGDSVGLSRLAGKKTLFIIVPLTGEHAVYQQLQSFKVRYADSVNIVGILSFEDGFSAALSDTIITMYSGIDILLTEGMYTRKAAGEDQSPLMQWLTDKNKNYHFSNDAAGAGSKFFISEGGRLFAVLGPQVSLQSSLIERVIQSSVQVQ